MTAMLVLAPATAAGGFDGSSPATAALSAKHILLGCNPFAPDGFYWMDPDGPFATNAVMMFADMTYNGGGWTLGILSRDTSPVSVFGISQNTGAASLVASHTRKVENLAELRDAQIRYVISNLSGVVFDGTYVGRFSDSTPAFVISTDMLGLNGLLDASYAFHAPGNDFDVLVYVREVVTPNPLVANVSCPSELLTDPTITDNGGASNVGPAIGSASEPFNIAIDCGGASANGIYILEIRTGKAITAKASKWGFLYLTGTMLIRVVGSHTQSTESWFPVPTGVVLPNDPSLSGVEYTVQGFCGGFVPRGRASNALVQTIRN